MLLVKFVPNQSLIYCFFMLINFPSIRVCLDLFQLIRKNKLAVLSMPYPKQFDCLKKV